ncbi:replication initiator protein [Flyfo microvirus Tbat2_130]|nr:replication initiator protein [Flyfo microvirus Tbat2_130]
MPCYSPLTAYQGGNGEVVFSEHKCKDVRRTLQLPCGQCHGCRLERSRQWAVRCMHEASMHENNSFITCTYSDEHLPKGGTLKYDDFQRFLKRLRHHYGEFRYYMCGEYGETTWRPHYHACIFGLDFDDKKYHTQNANGDKIYISRRLDEIWGMGQCTTAGVSFQSAAYVARYCMQKRTGKEAEPHYRRYNEYGKSYYLEPEFNEMSRRPGIGTGFFKKYLTDMYNDQGKDYVIVNGKETKPPKYYDRLLKRESPEIWQAITETREWEAYQRRDDNTPERLKVKEQVSQAATKQLKREL